jgi:fucose 4-O-acetylase-like acetyltransferase
MNSRDAYYDNAKFLLILLVVFGHFIQSSIQDHRIMLTLYHTIYAFHMPAFILISGFFAKGFGHKGYLRKVAKKLIIPYLMFQGIYSLFYYVIQGQDVSSINPLDPHWSLWFLLSLFFWNVMLYGFTRCRPALAIASSIILGVLVGYINEVNSVLSLSRTFVFFPLFLVGYYLDRGHFHHIKTMRVKIISFILLICTFVMFYFVPDFEHKWLFGSKPYEVLDAYGVDGALTRLGIYGLSFMTTLCFLALVPSREFFFTKCGPRTVYVYLLHGFFIKSFRTSELVNLLKDREQILLLSFVSLLLTMILSSDVIIRVTQPLIEVKLVSWKKFIVKLSPNRGWLQNR